MIKSFVNIQNIILFNYNKLNRSIYTFSKYETLHYFNATNSILYYKIIKHSF